MSNGPVDMNLQLMGRIRIGITAGVMHDFSNRRVPDELISPRVGAEYA
jgi:hypothetical protein